MATLTPTKDRGATAQPAIALYIEPDRQVTPDMLEGLAPGSGLNAPFVADLMSAVITHERCGRHLYRSCEGRTTMPELREKYGAFGAETERHVEILEELITAMGGNPNYVSGQARATELTDALVQQSTFLGEGSVDPVTAEMAMLDAVFLAETVDHANWKTLARLTVALPEGDVRDAFQCAVDEVEQQEDEHLEWAKQTRERLVIVQAAGK
jgi:rubrerythrin